MSQIAVKPRCFMCKRNHPLKYCVKFRNLSNDARRASLVGQDACFNCFGFGHSRSTCPSVNRCEICKAKHHTMIHREESEMDSSIENVPSTPTEKQQNVQIEKSYDQLPFSVRMTTFENAKPYDWVPQDADTRKELAPVIQCELVCQGKSHTVTLLLYPQVPKSCLLKANVKSAFELGPLRFEVAYCSCKISTPTGTITERFALVDKFRFYIPQPCHRPDIFKYAEGRKLAHPEPHNFKIDGVIGGDLADRVILGPLNKLEKNPNILLQETIFGLVFSGFYDRSNIPFLKSLCPLIRRDDGPFAEQPPS
ncbi:uncharacterized protein LOC142240818 [Haematobia irritans]|uniref:uncharacterized protein LOC142240818 n=1 Tax=Haematobia irritans TaxID=7368 RepID=UPI003F509D6C